MRPENQRIFAEDLQKFRILCARFKEMYADRGYRRDRCYGMLTTIASPDLRCAVYQAGEESDKRRMRVIENIARRCGWSARSSMKVGLHFDEGPLDNFAIWPGDHEATEPWRRYPAQFHERETGGIVREGRGNRAIRRARYMAEKDGGSLHRDWSFLLVRATWAYERRESNFKQSQQEALQCQ